MVTPLQTLSAVASSQKHETFARSKYNAADLRTNQEVKGVRAETQGPQRWIATSSLRA